MNYEQMTEEMTMDEKRQYGAAVMRQAEFWLLRLPGPARKVHLQHCTTQWNGEDRGYDRL